jgi:hypothetical protein
MKKDQVKMVAKEAMMVKIESRSMQRLRRNWM